MRASYKRCFDVVKIARRGRFAHVSSGGYSIHCLVPPGEKENRACAVLLLGLILGGNNLLRVGEEGTSNEPKQAQIAKDNLPVSRKLPDETCANDCWNSEDDADSCFSFRFHILTP